MEIIFKTLKGNKYYIEIDPSINIGTFKSIVQKEIKNNNIIKLIHKGKILENEQIIDKIGLKKGDFIIVIPIIRKKEKTKTKLEDSFTQSSKSKSSILYTEALVSNNSKQKKNENNESHSSIENTINISPIMESTITNLMGMGFKHEEILHSLKASSGNADLAVEYLLTGIPTNLIQQQTSETSEFSTTSSISQISTQQSPIVQQENIPNQNQVNVLLSQIIQNPALLNQILTAIQRTNPQLYNQIVQQMNANPQIAMGLVQQLFMNPQIMTQVLQSIQSDSQPIRQVFQLSKEEIEQISQLEKMGFSRDTVIRAFIVSDRNIEIAASLLFSDMDTFNDSLIENKYKTLEKKNDQANQQVTRSTKEDNLNNHNSGNFKEKYLKDNE